MTLHEMVKLKLSGKTYEDIGKLVGVSRQRIQQLISPPKEVREFVFTKFGGICCGCGKALIKKKTHIHHKNGPNTIVENYNDIDNLLLLCISCHVSSHADPSLKVTRICPSCQKPFTVYYFDKHKYCSQKCYFSVRFLNNNKNIAVGKNIKEQRQKGGISQVVLAGILGIAQTRISQIEHGKRHAPTWILNKIATFLRVTPAYLLRERVSGITLLKLIVCILIISFLCLMALPYYLHYIERVRNVFNY